MVALLALLVACSGTAYAAATVRSGDIVDGTIRSVDLKDGTIGRADLAPGAWRAVQAWRSTDTDYCWDPTVVGRFCGVLEFSASWVNYAGGWQEARYRRDATGQVQLEGLVRATSFPVGEDVFRLPAGLRPGKLLMFAVGCGTGQTGPVDDVGLVQVAPSGLVTWRAQDRCDDRAYLSLTGIRFQAP